MSVQRGTVAVILAAGQGVRMKSRLPKVLHELCGLPMLSFVIAALRQAGVSDLIVVVGYGADEVKARYAGEPLRWAVQSEQKGTGHAVMMAEPLLAGQDGDVIVACGDNPLLSDETVAQVLEYHRAQRTACTVVTAKVPNPTGYGRIVRGREGTVERIVEEKDATPEEKRITEINSGNYVFDCRLLFDALQRIRPDNRQREYLLTDVVKVLRAGFHEVMSYAAPDPTEVLGINSRAQLADAGRILQDRVQSKLMEQGVTIVDPRNTFIDPRVEIGPDTVVMPFTVIQGPAKIGGNCRIGPFAWLHGAVRVEDGSEVQGFRDVTGRIAGRRDGVTG